MNPLTIFLLGLCAAIVQVLFSALYLVVNFAVLDQINYLVDFEDANVLAQGAAASLVAWLVGLGLMGVGTMVASVLLTGAVSIVAMRATVGLKTSTSQALALLRGSYWRLIGYSLLLAVGLTVLFVALISVFALFVVTIVESALGESIWGTLLSGGLLLLGVAATVLVMMFFIVKLLVVPVAIAVEQTGLFAAIGRSWKLTRGNFWRTLGIYLLAMIVVGIISSVLTVPLQLLAGFGLELGTTGDELTVGFMIYLTVTTVITALFTGILGAVVAVLEALFYTDYRIRKEGFGFTLSQLATRIHTENQAGADMFALDPSARTIDDTAIDVVPGRSTTI